MATIGLKRTHYGLDAPGLMRGFLLAGAGAALIALLGVTFLGARTYIGLWTAVLQVLVACYCLGMATLMFTWSRVTKVRGRDVLLDRVPWRGDERVLDVGCGRGLLMVAAARRLTTGRAIGIDIWREEDQSRNSRAGALENASIEGVIDRVEVITADMRELPFEDGAFDGVMSHWVLHKLDDPADRTKALSEMRRVLRPGGWLILADIAFRESYMVELARLGLVDCRLFVHPLTDMVLRAISFGSFAPSAIYARRGN
jgi:ubiquinone/menaquinone biosynthesis C-methylase UbiE